MRGAPPHLRFALVLGCAIALANAVENATGAARLHYGRWFAVARHSEQFVSAADADVATLLAGAAAIAYVAWRAPLARAWAIANVTLAVLALAFSTAGSATFAQTVIAHASARAGATRLPFALAAIDRLTARGVTDALACGAFACALAALAAPLRAWRPRPVALALAGIGSLLSWQIAVLRLRLAVEQASSLPLRRTVLHWYFFAPASSLFGPPSTVAIFAFAMAVAFGLARPRSTPWTWGFVLLVAVVAAATARRFVREVAEVAYVDATRAFDQPPPFLPPTWTSALEYAMYRHDALTIAAIPISLAAVPLLTIGYALAARALAPGRLAPEGLA